MKTKKADIPAWAIEEHPEWVRPYVARAGLPSPWHERREPLGAAVAGVDFWHANNFIVYRDETAGFLYEDCTPLIVHYQPGTFPAYERLAQNYSQDALSDRDKALALLTQVLPAALPHPTIPPLGPGRPRNRALADEALLESGVAWCNEQARAFVRLCQVSLIPARLVFLFYADRRTGHTTAEFYADGRWCMVDSTLFRAVPGPHGRLLNAAQCHEEGPNREYVGKAFRMRVEDLLAMADGDLVGRKFAGSAAGPERAAVVAEEAENVREEISKWTAELFAQRLWVFGVLNYPLPPAET